jgi:hypothetical protein
LGLTAEMQRARRRRVLGETAVRYVMAQQTYIFQNFKRGIAIPV